MNIVFGGKQICTGVRTDSPNSFSYEGEEDEQVSKFLRGIQSVVQSRGNEFTTISFTHFKAHASIQAAQDYVLNFRQAVFLPKYGTLKLTSDDGTHATGQSMVLLNAHFRKGKARYEGSNTYCDYNFTGGMLTASSGN